LEESVRTLIEDDVLVGVRGAYRLAASPGAIQIPKTVQAILAARNHLTIATTMYRDMGMTYWLEKAEAEMKALA
jgi:hypothetical protein